MPECAVPLICTYVEPPTGSPTKGERYECRQQALPHTRPARCAQHLNAPVAPARA